MTKSVFPFAHSVRIPNVQAELDISEQEMQAQSLKRQTNFFDNFQTSGVILNWLEQQAAANPTRAEVIVASQTYNGNNIYALHLGKGASPKQTLVLHCGIHAREWITPTACCWIIDSLLKEPALLDSLEWVIIPVLNVDGYDYTHTTDRLWRKNRQPNPGSGCAGTDLNRNYGYAWSGPGASGNPCSETYYGSSAFSGPELHGLRDILQGLASQNRLAAYFDIHAYGALWMSPWGYTCNQVPSDYNEMNRVMTASITALRAVNGRTYAYGPICNTIYQTSGGSTDYTYGDLDAIHSYAVETFGNNFTPPPSFIGPIGREIWAGVRATALNAIAKLQKQ